MKRSVLIFYLLCAIFMIDLPSTFELEDVPQAGTYCSHLLNQESNQIETWMFAFSPSSTISIRRFHNDELLNSEVSQWKVNKLQNLYFETFAKELDYPKALSFLGQENSRLKLLLCKTLNCLPQISDSGDSKEGNMELFACDEGVEKGYIQVYQKNSNTTFTPSPSASSLMNEYIFGLVFIVLFIPPLSVLILQIVRAVNFQKMKGTYSRFFWIRLKDGPERVNVHLIVKLAFSVICFVRVIQGLLFIIWVASDKQSVALDRILTYWIDYINFNFLYAAAVLIVFYLVELGLVSLKQLGKRAIFSRNVTICFIGINVLFLVGTILLLALLAKNQGDPSTALFRILYNFIIAIPMLIGVLILYCVISFKLGKQIRQMTEKSRIHKAFRRLEIFIIVIALACMIRILAGFILGYGSYSIILSSTIIFIASSIPELILTSTLIIFTWIRKSDVQNPQEHKDLLDEDESTIAPEIFKFDVIETPKKVEIQASEDPKREN